MTAAVGRMGGGVSADGRRYSARGTGGRRAAVGCVARWGHGLAGRRTKLRRLTSSRGGAGGHGGIRGVGGNRGHPLGGRGGGRRGKEDGGEGTYLGGGNACLSVEALV